MQRLDIGLHSHPKEFGGRVESEPMLTPREKSPVPEKNPIRGGWNPRHCIKQDSEPNTLYIPTSYPGPERGGGGGGLTPLSPAVDADALPLDHRVGRAKHAKRKRVEDLYLTLHALLSPPQSWTTSSKRNATSVRGLSDWTSSLVSGLV